jgi:hypothetical protein
MAAHIHFNNENIPEMLNTILNTLQRKTKSRYEQTIRIEVIQKERGVW